MYMYVGAPHKILRENLYFLSEKLRFEAHTVFEGLRKNGPISWPTMGSLTSNFEYFDTLGPEKVVLIRFQA